MTDNKITVALTGDSFITQKLPTDNNKLKHIRDFMLSFDVRFTNFEITVHDFDVYPSATSGGTWAGARPFILKSLDWIGCNLFACANNHCLDWSHDGLLSTITHLEKEGLIYAGIGRNLAEANQPKYLDTKNGRVALISVTTSFEKWHRAGEQRPDLLGRPGVNPLGHSAVHNISEEALLVLQSISEETEVNASRNLSIKEGFMKENDDMFLLGNLKFQVGDAGTLTQVNQKDAERVIRSIKEASRQADLVLVSVHSHEMKGIDKEQPADFMKSFARLCIDEGAHAIVGHGPHILRGIEIYKEKPIFYSIGDFIFQNDSVERQPTEFYDIYHLDATHTPSDGFDARSNNGKQGLAANPKVYESVIPSFTFSNGKISDIKLTPISLDFHKQKSLKGRPSFTSVEDGEKILNHLSKLSEPFGTTIDIKEGAGYISGANDSCMKDRLTEEKPNDLSSI